MRHPYTRQLLQELDTEIITKILKTDQNDIAAMARIDPLGDDRSNVVYIVIMTKKEERFEEEIKRGVYSVSETENVWGWWSEGDFMVASTDKQAIEDLYQAFQALDVTISVGGGNVFQNGGLHFVIKSRISQEIIDDVYQKDLDNLNLKKAASSTGIYEKLEKAGKHFFALSPRWKDSEKKEIVFWLNPQEQHANNSGWYTISDLEDWIKGVGKIPKEKVS